MKKRVSAAIFVGFLTFVFAAVLEAQSTTGYKVPRTPWGDPDLQGTYSNAFEANTPMERPAEFDGRRHEDLSADETAGV